MGISRYNSEGYSDPTAFEAVRQIEADKKIFKIEYSSGYIELRMDRFFPCTINKAKKISRLIDKYSSEADKERLIAYLKNIAQKYTLQSKQYANKAISYPVASKEAKRYTTMFKEAKRLHKRAVRNIEIFSGGRN